MGRRRTKPRSGWKASRQRPSPTAGWQLWAVAAGVVVVLAVLGLALVRGTGPFRTEFEGTVVEMKSMPRPGALDPQELRQLTLEQSDGSRLTVEVEERLFEAVGEGYFVRRTRQGELEARDPEGRTVSLTGQTGAAEGE